MKPMLQGTKSRPIRSVNEAPDWCQRLELGSDQPEVQAMIRKAVQKGLVRVRPLQGEGGRVQVIPDT